MPVACFYCDQTFADYTTLAMHIIGSKRGHRRGKRWAAKYVMLNKLSPEAKGKHNHQTPLTEQEKANKESAVRILSGINKTMPTYCPKCKTECRQPLPVEYAESPAAWRTNKGILIVVCPQCQNLRKGYSYRATPIRTIRPVPSPDTNIRG